MQGTYYAPLNAHYKVLSAEDIPTVQKENEQNYFTASKQYK